MTAPAKRSIKQHLSFGSGRDPDPYRISDAILYGTGPRDTTTSVHVGIVETVRPDGRITTIEGNLSNRVEHNGPFDPAHATASGEPAAVYAFARASG